MPVLIMTPLEKTQNFHKELKELLKKYDAQLIIETQGRQFFEQEVVVIEFGYDESFFEEYNTGIVPDLVLGSYENGNETLNLGK